VLKASPYLQPPRQPLCRRYISSEWLKPPATASRGFGKSPPWQQRNCLLGCPNSGFMVPLGPQTESVDGHGNLHRMESSSKMQVSAYCKPIRLAVRVRPNCPVPSCSKPGDTAVLSRFDTLPPCPSVDRWLSGADGQYSTANINGSSIRL